MGRVLIRFFTLALAVVPPVPGPVTQHFVAPTCQRCAGHRGITIDNPDGVAAVSPVAGTVSFAGTVAHRWYVVVQPRPGVLVTVGHLASIEVSVGDVVGEGQQVGVAGASTYLGVRVRGVYVEPLGFLGFGRVRLVGGGAVVGLRAMPR